MTAGIPDLFTKYLPSLGSTYTHRKVAIAMEKGWSLDCNMLGSPEAIFTRLKTIKHNLVGPLAALWQVMEDALLDKAHTDYYNSPSITWKHWFIPHTQFYKHILNTEESNKIVSCPVKISSLIIGLYLVVYYLYPLYGLSRYFLRSQFISTQMQLIN